MGGIFLVAARTKGYLTSIQIERLSVCLSVYLSIIYLSIDLSSTIIFNKFSLVLQKAKEPLVSIGPGSLEGA